MHNLEFIDTIVYIAYSSKLQRPIFLIYTKFMIYSVFPGRSSDNISRQGFSLTFQRPVYAAPREFLHFFSD